MKYHRLIIFFVLDCMVYFATSSKCNSNQFQCGSGKCIPSLWRCDDEPDCEDSSDEEGCPPRTCLTTEFKCEGGKCIQERWVCDGEDDCNDSDSSGRGGPTINLPSDERNCTNRTCASDHFKCNKGNCIPMTYRCDLQNDCPQGEDEVGCNQTSCDAGEFMCGDGKCITGRWLCDQDNDCGDNSDEEGCPVPTCSPDKFRCVQTGGCISLEWKCDGDSDCADSSDEANCTKQCSAHEWRCDSGQCIDRSFRCNNVKNCPDNSDEVKCNSTDHNNTTNNNDSLTNNVEAYLLLSQRRSVNIINLSSKRSTPLVNNLRTAVSLDYSYNGHQLFVSDVRSRTIYVSNISISSKNTTSTPLETVVNNTDTVDGIAYDWVHDILYWTDKGRKTIELLTMSGRHHRTIVSVHLDEPRGIALDPRDGQKWLYWTDWGDKPRIEKAGLDGSNRALVVATDIGWPNDVTIDYAGDRLYWVDGKHHSISSSDLNGQNVRKILSQQQYTMHPFSIDVFVDKIYWSDWNTDSVYQANKRDGTIVTIVSSTYSPMGLKVYHPLKQPNGTNPCGVNNGGCSHICLAAPSLGSAARMFNCFCPDGKHVNEDGRTCYTPGHN